MKHFLPIHLLITLMLVPAMLSATADSHQAMLDSAAADIAAQKKAADDAKQAAAAAPVQHPTPVTQPAAPVVKK